MKIYIKGSSAISPVQSFYEKGEINTPQIIEESFVCLEPDYKEFINPLKMRRMSRIVKMGLSCALEALKKSKTEKIDAIITATGLGCINDTELFLNQMITNEETLLNPTPFIQSTHNTIAGQIAIFTSCNEMNFTFSQNEMSFESALLETQLLLKTKEATSILLGASDELTKESKGLIQQVGCAKSANNSKGYLCGEGANFFVLSSQKTDICTSELLGLELNFNLKNEADLIDKITLFLKKHEQSIEQIDTFFSGNNKSNKQSAHYEKIEKHFSSSKIIYFKDYCGEYATATAFGFWLAQKKISEKKSNNILICNIEKNNLSLILLSEC